MDEKEMAIHYATEHSIGAMMSWLGDKKSGAEAAKETSEIIDPKMEAEAQESDPDTEETDAGRGRPVWDGPGKPVRDGPALPRYNGSWGSWVVE